VLTAAAVVPLMCLPAARQALMPPRAINPRLFMVSRAPSADGSQPTISFREYQAWRAGPRRNIRELAFYTLSGMTAHIAGASAALRVATASDNLPALLHIPVSQAAVDTAHSEGRPAVLLSDSLCRKLFRDDPEPIGRTVKLAGHETTVVAVIPDDAWRLTTHPDAWLLEDESALNSLAPTTSGFVLGETVPSPAPAATRGRWEFAITKDGHEDVFYCATIAKLTFRPWMTFLFTLFLAIAALPATTPLPLGDYPAANHPLFAAMRWRRWIFLGMKLVFAVLIVYFASTALAFASPSLGSNASVYIQFSTSFLGLLFAFRWALRDQRRRCPVCLHHLTNPVSVGHPSRNFLAWHGTELVCSKGHGLLHIPEMATSWFSTQRWLCLDATWAPLFSDPCSL
jgi:hypothetical protein